mmetsp:Transcript_59561/g.158447  ORF Transcript_59561/g.158447 Transcript_59561/m.158447 type:complete len:353 (+) Transcript_59561:995-2053(+)
MCSDSLPMASGRCVASTLRASALPLPGALRVSVMAIPITLVRRLSKVGLAVHRAPAPELRLLTLRSPCTSQVSVASKPATAELECRIIEALLPPLARRSHAPTPASAPVEPRRRLLPHHLHSFWPLRLRRIPMLRSSALRQAQRCRGTRPLLAPWDLPISPLQVGQTSGTQVRGNVRTATVLRLPPRTPARQTLPRLCYGLSSREEVLGRCAQERILFPVRRIAVPVPALHRRPELQTNQFVPVCMEDRAPRADHLDKVVWWRRRVHVNTHLCRAAILASQEKVRLRGAPDSEAAPRVQFYPRRIARARPRRHGRRGVPVGPVLALPAHARAAVPALAKVEQRPPIFRTKQA